MRTTYRGCHIEAVREEAMGGWIEIYWSCFTGDGYEITSGFGMYGTVREAIRAMKRLADSFIDTYKQDSQRWERRQDIEDTHAENGGAA